MQEKQEKQRKRKPIGRLSPAQWLLWGWALLVGVGATFLTLSMPGASDGDVAPEAASASGAADTTPSDPPPNAAEDEETADTAAPSLWAPVDIGAVDARDVPSYKEVVEGRVLVRLSDRLDLAAGETISITIPQLGETYTPVIQRVNPGPGDVRAYIGTLVERGRYEHGFVVTVGPRNTFAHLSTPYGVYELVGNRDLAWLMATANMDQHVDYSKSDVVPDAVVQRWRELGRRGRNFQQ